jgi:hypothetical protein
MAIDKFSIFNSQSYFKSAPPRRRVGYVRISPHYRKLFLHRPLAVTMQLLWERGRLDRRFRRPAENPPVVVSRTNWCWQGPRKIGRREIRTNYGSDACAWTGQGDRDGRAPKSNRIVPA